MAYSRNVRTRTAIVIISMCWVAGTIVGFLPLFGWHVKPENQADMSCHFVKVMDYNYLVFLYFATIITPALLMLAFYTHIYRVIVKQVRQIVTMNPTSNSSRRSSNTQVQITPGRPHGGTMLRVLGASRKRDVKATQNLSIIVLFFMICWFPLYTINCIKAFCPDCQVPGKLTLFCIILSHLNSAGNPVLYAYHLKDFRLALKNLLLKIIGIEVEPVVDPMHRFSLASQHRLQSIEASLRHSLQPRIYIDSPIWLRQQQQSLKNSQSTPKCGVITPCLNNINQTVTAVASVPADIGRDMWNIVEASSGAELEGINYEFPIGRSANTPPTPASQQQRRGSSFGNAYSASYSYNNCNYYISPDESELDEVFLPTISNSSGSNSVDSVRPNGRLGHARTSEEIAHIMREKLRSDDTEYQTQMRCNQRALTDSSYSDCDMQKKSAGHTPPAKGRLLKTTHQRRLSQLDAVEQSRGGCSTGDTDGGGFGGGIGSCSRSTSSLSGLSNAGVYVVEKDTSPLSPPRKRKFKKAQRLPMNSNKAAESSNNKTASGVNKNSRSYSCTSESLSTPTKGVANGTKVTQTPPANTHSNSASNDKNAPKAPTHNNSNNGSNNHNNYNFNCHATERQPHTIHCHGHDKFSRLRAVSHLIFPPIVKHSSLFHLFQPSATSAENVTAHNASTVDPTCATTTATIASPDSVASSGTSKAPTTTTTTTSECSEQTPQTTVASRIASVDESIKTTATDLTDPAPTPQSRAQPPPPTIDVRLS
ncbi:PREDICTED: uncharacterized protein LOC108376790 [Rhagoletis zephyria]|uniref:uncharacterized protein LOC108376790 n=1 Tax=Rhagoletis zephyria TaxID=28612 RepID=UPI0008113F0D|nr:PREDICTED: uncharacterized protein LOC108376790 [Rhagoletis zephyria]